MTLDTYGHLVEDRLNEVGDAVDAARRAAQEPRAARGALSAVAPVSPEPDLGEKAERDPSLRFRKSGPLRGPVPPTGFEPALPP